MRQLSGMDAMFLAAESARWPMHVASVSVFDPSGAPGGYTLNGLKKALEARLDLLPALRWRVAEPPFGLSPPYWIEDPDFDLEAHIRRVAVPAPGDRHELAELAADIYRYRLDRRRPLWQWWILEGLEGGHVASLFKIHHAYIDGISGVDLHETMFDHERQPTAGPRQLSAWRPERVPGDAELFLRSLPYFARSPLRLGKQLRSLLGRLPGLIGGDAIHFPGHVPRVSFNNSVSQQRSFAFTTISLSQVKEVKNRFGTKVNDVVLAICAESLRRYLEERGELPDDSLIASVPVNIREDGTSGQGNRISGMLTSLATDIADPVERLRAIYRNTQESKLIHQAIGAETLMGLADTPPPSLIALALRSYARMGLVRRHRPLFNVVISNVPGSADPLYHLGAELKALYSMGINMDGVGLFIGLMSHQDQIDLGVLACRELVPDPWPIADGMNRALDELVREAGALARDAPRPGPPPPPAARDLPAAP